MGAGTSEVGAVARGGPAGAEVPASARAAFRRATNSVSLFLFFVLRTISAQEAQFVRVKSINTQVKISAHRISK